MVSNFVSSHRRRRHHCRKCGCIVCYKCSSQSAVIPRLGKGLQRVCDSCYNNVHCDPCSNLVEDCIEANLQAKMRQNTLRVGVITSCDVVVQAIVQGLSIAMTGSPLGKEVDVECFSSPPTSSWQDPHHPGGDGQPEEESRDSTSPRPPPSLSLPSGYLPRHFITPSSMSSSSASRSRGESGLRGAIADLSLAMDMDGTPRQSLPPRSPPPPAATSRYIRSDADSRACAYHKALLAYDQYCQRFNTPPDFSVAVVFGVSRDDAPHTATVTSVDSGKGRRLSSDLEWEEGEESRDANTPSSPAATAQQTSSASSASRGADSSASYQMFYWVMMFDGDKMNSSRSASICLPPSLCAHIQKREQDFARHHALARSQQQRQDQSGGRPPPPLVSIFDFDLDVEEELVAAILREGDASSPYGSHASALPAGVLSIANALSGGIVGWLTGGRMTRASYLQSVVQLAYMPFQWKNLYEMTDV